MAHQHDHAPKAASSLDHVEVPDTMTYTDDEKALARAAQADAEKKSKKPLIIGGSALAAAIIAGGAWIGLSGGDKEETPPSEPTAAAPAETGSNGETDNTVEELVVEPISAEVYTTPEAVMERYVELYNEWTTANARPETREGYLQDINQGRESYIARINEPVDDAYAETLYAPGWQENAQLREVVDGIKDEHALVVLANMATTDSLNDADLEPYTAGLRTTSFDVIEQSEHHIVVDWRFIGWDNADQNRAELFVKSIDGRTGGSRMTWENIDGVWKISDTDYYDGN